MKRYQVMLLAALALCASAAKATPTIQFVDNLNSTVSLQIVVPNNGSIGAELAASLVAAPTLTLTGVTVNTAIFDTPNPGDNPFIPGSPVGGDSNGLWVDLPNNRTFASFGGGPVAPGAYDFLTISYTGFGRIDAFGVVAQVGVLTRNLTASIDVVPEPSAAILAALGVAGVVSRRRAA